MRLSKRRKVRIFLDSIVVGDSAAVKEMLASGVPVDARDTEHGETALMLAGRFGRDAAILSLLLDAGADVNAKDTAGRTPIMVAKAAFVFALLAAGARIDARDNDGETALMKAAASADSDKVRMLLENGADKTMTDQDGKSAWDHANASGFNVLTDLPELYC